MLVIQELKRTYIMKGVGKPQYYLGGDVVGLVPEWEKEGISEAFSAETYIQNALLKLVKSCGLVEFRNFIFPFVLSITQSWMRLICYQMMRSQSTNHCWEVLIG